MLCVQIIQRGHNDASCSHRSWAKLGLEKIWRVLQRERLTTTKGGDLEGQLQCNTTEMRSQVLCDCRKSPSDSMDITQQVTVQSSDHRTFNERTWNQPWVRVLPE